MTDEESHEEHGSVAIVEGAQSADRAAPVRAVRDVWGRFVDWFSAREPSEHAVLVGFAAVIGVLTAGGVIAFYKAIDLAYAAFYRWPQTFLPRLSVLAYRPLLTAAGLFVAWLVMRRIGHGHDGLNVPDVQLAVVRRGGDIPARPAFARTLASAITIGSGGSAGSEGPVVVFGAAIASWLGRTFRFAPARVVTFVGCATGAAISAAFNAPLAGAFFALEEILGSFAGVSFAPVVVSSVLAAVVSRSVFGNHPAFPIPHEYGYAQLSELLVFYPLLGVLCALVSVFFVRAYFKVGEIERRLRLSPALVPWIGGALVGALVVASRGLLVGYGHLAVHLEVFGRMAWYALFALAIGSAIATSITLNFGGSGGVFTPSLYVGAATGGAMGAALLALFPHSGLHPEAYALVGMGALIAGATNAPITGILLVFEMTNDYAIVLPLMLTVVICSLVARRIEHDSLYSGWLRRRGETIEHGADTDVLAGLRVVDAYDPTPDTISEGESAAALLRHLGHGEQVTFPVIDDDRCVRGVISLAELGQVAGLEPNARALLIAADLARPTETMLLGDSLLDAIRRMGVRGAPSLPVVDSEGRLLGLLSRSHVLNIYERSVAGAAMQSRAPAAQGWPLDRAGSEKL